MEAQIRPRKARLPEVGVELRKFFSGWPTFMPLLLIYSFKFGFDFSHGRLSQQFLSSSYTLVAVHSTTCS